MYERFKDFQLLLLGVVLVIGIIAGAKIVSDNLSQSGITVTGSAYEVVKSDTASVNLEITAQNASKAEAYAQIKTQIPTVQAYLEEKSVKPEEITLQAPTSYPTYKQTSNGVSTNEIAYYNFSQSVKVKSGDIEKVKDISLDAQSLLDKGININTGTPEYNYSKLSDLKIKLLGEAAKDAKVRATEMLKATHNRVGKIKSVKMGVFQITSPDSNEVSDWGINDTTSIDKKVTAVANVVFNVK